MYRATFHPLIDPPWTGMEPLRLGNASRVLGTADRFVAVDSEQRPVLRIDLYRSSEESFAFEQICVWSEFVAIGWGHRVYLVRPPTREVLALDLGSYFGHMYLTHERLLVASAARLFCISSGGSLLWQSGLLGIDGVIVDQVADGTVRGQGEWDPPNGWRPFSIDLHTGNPIEALH